jgi:hypothetical protein
MLTLDFTYIEEWSYKFDFPEERWVEYLEVDGFLGGQVFTIEQANFSGDYPLLGFARWLDNIAYHLKASGIGGFWLDEEMEKNSLTQFSLDAESVLVEEVGLRPDKRVIASAHIGLDEFASAAGAYKERVYTHCCSLFPPLASSESVKAWLNEYPDPRTRHQRVR